MTQEIQELLDNPLLGCFCSIELIEIVGLPVDGQAEPFNIFTIMVAQEKEYEPDIKDRFLTQKPISLCKDKNFKIGILKSILSKDELAARLSLLSESTWQNCSRKVLACGKLSSIPKVFVPVSDFQQYDFQGLLKNHFMGGSYVFEWFDESKCHVRSILENPDCLSEISEKVQQHLPIKIGRFSDRLGNFILQIPCLSVSVQIQRRNRHNHHFTLDVAVHPHLADEALKLSGMFWRKERGIFTDICRQALQFGQNEIPFKQKNGRIHWLVFDDSSGQVCAGGITAGFIESASLEMRLSGLTARTFILPENTASRLKTEVHISELISQDQPVGDYRNWIDNRVFQNEKIELQNNLKLVQFQSGQRDKALKMFRALLKQHGKYGAFLWDPYLSASDLLETLFFCPYAHVPLRALSGLKIIDGSTKQQTFEIYRNQLNRLSGNQLGLNLIFLNADLSGGHFHDRFLIFPRHISRSARVWSLGTSVNSIGNSHHIIQEVGDGQMIADAFENMWNQSNIEENIIWKSESH